VHTKPLASSEWNPFSRTLTDIVGMQKSSACGGSTTDRWSGRIPLYVSESLAPRVTAP